MQKHSALLVTLNLTQPAQSNNPTLLPRPHLRGI